MGKRKKAHYDRMTEKKGLSQARNLGTDRVIKKIKEHAEITGHKVLVNFIPTWELGKNRTWTSRNWGDTIPLKVGQDGNVVPLLEAVANQPNNLNPAVGGGQAPTVEEDLPDSQEMRRRPPAKPGNQKDKQKMGKVCAKCYAVKGSKMDTDQPWLRCGVSRCSKLNVHAHCHGIKLINGQEKAVSDFCKLYVRCQGHFEEMNNDEETTDEDFETVKKKPKKIVPRRVFTPGTNFIDSSPELSKFQRKIASPGVQRAEDAKKKDATGTFKRKNYIVSSIVSSSQNNNKHRIGKSSKTPISVRPHKSTKKLSAYETLFPEIENFENERTEEMFVVEPVAVSVEVDLEKYRHFITLLHKCCAEEDQAQSLEINVIRSFFAKAERKTPFSNIEIDDCIDKMEYENKVMRSDDTVFII